ncbi:hypothetical protein CGMCC3_g12412 [Colletotrichum fructicola]|uniref:Uncharacterized protein n=1 Tax=Colletotrichum fructicola (strain Nara gc5) TaxID=1213859 RepID=A0A7J6JH61_COLFN|nr:uncharacterized protein CGMCC3_g12412 [Colletotrichum fructicola]KAE9571571.1 hypothetical protein CGMCC3_g12412 [Colletotrichum fructicola]KAF4421963.1 hypothetical protein CFRS1_v012318 [Colletotrichum fructicola]KAF4489033.1 hypothetical protein CGGC5_v004591 [Colletotrichum fructicola Nara gc5]
MTGPSNAYIDHGPATLISEEIADIPINASACLAQGQQDLPYRWEVEEQNRNISPNSMIPQSVADAFNAQNLMYQKIPVLLPQQPFERYSENDNGAAIFAVEFESLFDAEANSERKLQILHIACDKVIRYRRHDGYRLFPPEDFYEYLLQNEPDRDETTPIATRCAKWFHSMTPSDADLRIDELLELRKSLTTPSPADLRHVNFPKQTAPASKGKAKASEITDHQHPLIAREMAKSATMGYRSLIHSMEHFDELEEAYDNHIRKDVLESPAETDATWPVSQEMQYGYIGQAFVAIFDTASFAEKTAALAKQARIDETNAATQETPAECQTEATPSGSEAARRVHNEGTLGWQDSPRLGKLRLFRRALESDLFNVEDKQATPQFASPSGLICANGVGSLDRAEGQSKQSRAQCEARRRESCW